MSNNLDIFKKAKKYNRLNLFFLVLSFIIVLINVFLSCKFLEIINCVIVFLYYIINLIINDCLYKGERFRRNDLLDNSFGSKFELYNTRSYYAPNGQPYGIVKMGLHVYESCLYTYRQFKIQVIHECVVFALCLITYFILACCGYSTLVLLIVQLLLPICVIKQCIIDIYAYSQFKSVFESFNMLARNSFFAKDNEVELIKNIEDYNTILCYFHILLSEKIYHKYKDKLAQEWSSIQQQYNLTGNSEI